MGSDFSYSILVEEGGRLLINDQEVAPPRDVLDNGTDPLGWALDMVRDRYGKQHEKDSDAALTLTVRDARLGGLAKRARFTEPSSAISLDGLLGRGQQQREAEPPAEPAEPTEARSEESPASGEGAQESGPEDAPVGAGEVTEVVALEEKHLPESGSEQPETPVGDPAPEEPSLPPARGKDWIQLAPDENSRPQVNPTDADREARGVTAEKTRVRKRRILQAGAAVVAAVVIGLGLRVWGQGAEYDAVCVDQRTMSRVVSGAACTGDDTNHHWWYVESSESLPEVGESVDRTKGSFEEPAGENNTIIRHVQQEEQS